MIKLTWHKQKYYFSQLFEYRIRTSPFRRSVDAAASLLWSNKLRFKPVRAAVGTPCFASK